MAGSSYTVATEFMEAVMGTADWMRQEVQEIVTLAEEQSIKTAHQVLISNLSHAIESSIEYHESPYKERLFAFFNVPDAIQLQGGKVITNPRWDRPSRYFNEWNRGKKRERTERHVRNKVRGRAAKLEPVWREYNWSRIIENEYPHPVKSGGVSKKEGIENRLQYMTSEAPFWVFLEYGSSGNSTIHLSPTLFLHKTKNEIVGYYRDLVKAGLDTLVKPFTTANTPAGFSWTRPYLWRGQVLTAMRDRSGKFTGQRIRLG